MNFYKEVVRDKELVTDNFVDFRSNCKAKKKVLSSFFSIPKPFQGKYNIIQRNAIESWVRSYPGCEVILIGDEIGVEEAARDFGCRHIAEVDKNELGTPLLNDAFIKARQIARNDLLCYVNADIIILSDFLQGLKAIPFERYLCVGRRWNIDLDSPVNFKDPGWEPGLRKLISQKGELFTPYGIDYFVFPKSMDELVTGMPPFAVGRPRWDNWFIFRARLLGYPVVDGSQVMTAVHQNHDYAHVKFRSGPQWEGQEGERNTQLADGIETSFSILDATYFLRNGKIYRAWTEPYIQQRLKGPVTLWKYQRSKSWLDRIKQGLFWRFFHLSSHLPKIMWRLIVYYLTP